MWDISFKKLKLFKLEFRINKTTPSLIGWADKIGLIHLICCQQQIKIYSLRDTKNEPHATIEIQQQPVKSIHQIKGKANKEIVAKYHKYVSDFIDKAIKKKAVDPNNIVTTTGKGDLQKAGLIANSTPSGLVSIYNIPAGANIGHLRVPANSKIKLPNDLTVETLDFNEFKGDIILPKNLEIQFSLHAPHKNIVKIGDNFKIKGDLNLAHHPLTHLPRMYVRGNVDASFSNIETIKPGSEIYGNLSLNACKKLEKIPEDISVKGTLDITDSSVKEVSDGADIRRLRANPAEIKTNKPLIFNQQNIVHLQRMTKLPNFVELLVNFTVGPAVTKLPKALVMPVGTTLDMTHSRFKTMPANYRFSVKTARSYRRPELIINTDFRLPKGLDLSKDGKLTVLGTEPYDIPDDISLGSISIHRIRSIGNNVTMHNMSFHNDDLEFVASIGDNFSCGMLDLSHNRILESIGKNLRVNGHLDLKNSAIKSLNTGWKIEGDLILNEHITKIPNDIQAAHIVGLDGEYLTRLQVSAMQDKVAKNSQTKDEPKVKVKVASKKPKYKKGDRVIIVIDDLYYKATMTAVRRNRWYFNFDDGDKGDTDDINDIVGMCKSDRLLKRAIKKDELHKFLEV